MSENGLIGMEGHQDVFWQEIEWLFVKGGDEDGLEGVVTFPDIDEEVAISSCAPDEFSPQALEVEASLASEELVFVFGSPCDLGSIRRPLRFFARATKGDDSLNVVQGHAHVGAGLSVVPGPA